MSTIYIRCVDQTLTITNSPLIASGDIGIDSVEFDFCNLWNDYTKTAVFWKSEDSVYHQILDANDTCVIPNEILANDGTMFFGVFGVDESEHQRTSEVLRYKIVKGAITENTQPSDPTPEIYTQLLAKYTEMNTNKADKVTSATNGNFAGLDANGNLTDSGKKATDFQPVTNELGEITALANDDYFPFYDTSASAHKKTLWSNIVSKIRTAFFGTANGLLKANGSGTISATKIGDELLTGYAEAAAAANVLETDTLNVALGKMQKAINSQTSPIGTANGVLKADGSGNVSAAARGTDYSLVNTQVIVSVPYTGWTLNSATNCYEQSVAVTGLLTTDDKRTRVEIMGNALDPAAQILSDEAAALLFAPGGYVACNTNGYLYLRCPAGGAAPEVTFSLAVIVVR